MDNDHNASISTDEYFMTAAQIFEYCGGDNSGTLHVDSLMDKFAPFVKTDKSEFILLKSLLDPDNNNPEISVTRLASTLRQYSNQKTKADLDESFNLRSGPMPLDSDSGISTDGFQLLEELQCELREKAHLTNKLRSQLDFTDRQHEEVVATLTAERESVRAHLNMLREENMTLTHVKRDYEEACDRLCASERALETARRDLEGNRTKLKHMDDQIQTLEAEKLTLQELLSKSKSECHRINEMYASRQSVLLEENETLRTEHADMAAKLQDHDEFVQQIIKEKVLLEMELKDILNKSNHTQLRLDRSIDVSYTEDQMLSTLDTLNADTRFDQDHHLLDEEAFVKALKEDQGRMTNLSLFDEIRLSMSNTSRQDFNTCYSEQNTTIETRCEQWIEDHTSMITVSTQTEQINELEIANSCTDSVKNDENFAEIIFKTVEIQTDINEERITVLQTIGTQTEEITNKIDVEINCSNCSKNNKKSAEIHCKSIETQTYTNVERIHVPKMVQEYESDLLFDSNKNTVKNTVNSTERNSIAIQTFTEVFEKLIQTDQYENNNTNKDCLHCKKHETNTTKLENDLKKSLQTMKDLQETLDKYEQNLDLLQNFLDDGHDKKDYLQTIVKSLESKLEILEDVCANQKDRIDNVPLNDYNIETFCAECQTDSGIVLDTSSVGTQVEVPCKDCVKRNVVQQRSIKRYLWDILKSLFQLFAVLCFACAASVLYSVTRRWRARCDRDPVPWRWLDVHELMDVVLRIEYVADVPM